MDKDKKLTKGRLRTIIVTGISCVLALALIITNAFIPVKYLASYIVIRNKGVAEGTMRVRFVDVGYGDCTIIELPDGKNMLIDGGDGSSSHESKILKFLNKCDIDTIDYLVCTSVNAEHCGGLAELIQYKKVKKTYMPYCTNASVNDSFYNFVYAVKTNGVEIVYNGNGVSEYNNDFGYFFTVISPSDYTNPEGEYEIYNNDVSSETARNNISAVIWLEYAGTGFLFTSDVTQSVLSGIVSEYKLLKDIGEDYCTVNGYSVNLENCNVVTVANHGNSDSACTEFYKLLDPEIAVISVGDNGQNCPSDQVITDVGTYTEPLLRTDRDGTVTIEVTKDGYGIV